MYPIRSALENCARLLWLPTGYQGVYWPSPSSRSAVLSMATKMHSNPILTLEYLRKALASRRGHLLLDGGRNAESTLADST